MMTGTTGRKHPHAVSRWRIALCAVFTLVYCCSTASAQDKLTFQQLDNSSGLSNSCLNNIFSDSRNLLWLGTWDGLNVYDGSSFHIFNYSQGNPQKSIGSNIIYHLAEDGQKDVWIATIEGVSRYGRKTGNFRNYFYNKLNDAGGVARGYLLAADTAGSDVYATYKSSAQLYYYRADVDSFQSCTFSGHAPGNIVKIMKSPSGHLWLLNQKGELSVYAANGGRLVNKKVLATSAPVENFFFANNAVFFTTVNKELFSVGEGFTTAFVLSLPYSIRSMAFYKGRYLLAWASKGLGEYTADFRPAPQLVNSMPSLAGMRITTIVPGSQHMLWLGTDGNGMIRVATRQNQFGLVKKWPNGEDINIPIRAFNEVGNELWVGTKGSGIVKIKQHGGAQGASMEVKPFLSSSDLLSNRVYSIQKGAGGYVYIGSDAQGITVYDVAQKTWYEWNKIEGSKSYAPFSSVHSMLMDPDGSVWMGLEALGLVHLKLERNEKGLPVIRYLYRYPHTGNNAGPGNNVIYALEEGNEGQVLIGCRYGGLSIFDKARKTFRTIKAAGENGLSNNDVLSLYKDSRQQLWIGTSYGMNVIDIARLNDREPVFRKITTEDGLPNNTIHGITEDGGGNIWASSNKGLVKIAPHSFAIMRFRQPDGLQSNEFSDGAVWKNDKGYLFFGGIYGFNYFLPDSVQAAQSLSNLLISNFQLAGNSLTQNMLKVLPAEGDYQPDVFSSGRDANYFELTVKSINFSAIEKCQYAYMLEGSHRDWRYTGEDGKIIYNNILPGNYKLKVKWSNGDGKWTRAVTVMELNVRQYFWLTFPAFLVYSFILFTGWYVFYIYRKDKTEMKHRLEIERRLRLKDEEVHRGQQDFFTNITHELQTPLTLILGGLERFIQKNKDNRHIADQPFISLVHQQASRLSYLAHQLLEFRRAEEGFVKNRYSFFNVSNLLENICGLFNRHEERKQLDFSQRITAGIELWTDKDKLEKIVFNLLSNAFKHTGVAEKVLVEVFVEHAQRLLVISVANSGITLAQKDVERVFDRFFTSAEGNDHQLGTGLGLAFAKELAGLLNGRLQVACDGGWIAFHLTLPLDFVPDRTEIVSGGPQAEIPSALLRDVADDSYADGEAVTGPNKKALVSSLGPEEKKSILIIDDEPAVRFLLRNILEDYYTVYEAEGARQGLELMRSMPPHLIISDIMMPDMGGVELCAIVKNTPDTCHIPFILLTARNTVEQKTEGYDAGADAYVAKPFNIDHLLVRVRKLLEYRQKLHTLFNTQQGALQLPEEGMKEHDKELFAGIYKIVEEHMDDEHLDAAFLEKALALSKMQLYRKLKSLSGMTPNELIKHIRLQKAAQLLRSDNLTVAEVFYKTGFNNRSYFFREFKKAYNCSPNDYRQQHQLPSA